MVSSAFDLFSEDERDGCVSFDGFVKTLFYMGMDRFNTGNDYQLSLSKMMQTYVKPYNEAHRILNLSDGSEGDEVLLSIPEIDRILYVYDSVFDRLFNRYRDVDQHTNRELTLDQNKLLDQFVEVEEMKELLKDFNLFPRMVAFTDISRTAQYACFGKIVVDPSRQGGARYSAIDAKKDASADMKMEAVAATDIIGEAANPLYVPILPAEYLTDEALLDKARFMSAIVRLAQCVYSRGTASDANSTSTSGNDSLPTKTSRLEALLKYMEPYYEKLFMKTMQSDCDYTEKGLPTISLNAPFYPSVGPMSGFEMSINGGNFCEKRGVFVRFGVGSDALVVRSKSIAKKKIVVDVPQGTPQDVEVGVEFNHGEYDIAFNRVARLRVECSNNRWQYTKTEPPQLITMKQQLPPYSVDEETSAKLMKLFGAVCAFQDSFNTKLMIRSKWKALKEHCELTEAATEGGPDHDVYFMEVAEFHDGAHDLSLNFKGFLRVLSRTLLAMKGEEHWVEGLQFVADRRFETQKRVGVEQSTKADQSDVALARRALAMIERRPHIELDIFLGPIIVGSLKGHPGDIASATSGSTVVLAKNHPMFTYTHYECNTQSTVLAHITASQGIHHLIRRLLHDGFDVACHHPNINTRKPAGRCWTIKNAQGTRVGAMWDYAGNYSNLEWQPAQQEMLSANYTLCTYVEEKSIEYVLAYLCTTKAKDMAQLRAQLTTRGFTFTTKLYRLPF
eukprot:GILI01016819.1.p1 GENE.GILI01016819.1~~GILI01016819.1.p1  ORF type:complete len:761 (+),score=132.45 GILI01016819.1:91-2283(+)